MLGKSAGIALLAAAALLLALLAMGVFSPGGAKADGHIHLDTLSIKAGPDSSDTAIALDPVFDSDDEDRVREYKLALSREAANAAEMNTIRVEAGQRDTAIRDDYTVTMTVTNANMGEEINTSEQFGSTRRITGATTTAGNLISHDLTGAVITITVERADDDTTETVDESGTETYTIRVVSADQDVAVIDKTEATAGVKVQVKAALSAQVGNEIVLNLKSFGIPETIATTNVLLNDGENIANPTDVDVDGDNVVIVFGKFDNDALNNEDVNVLAATDGVPDETLTVTLTSRAGITNPEKAGNYWITVDSKDAHDDDGDAVDARRRVTIVRSLAISPKSAGKGTEVTVTGKGFANGSVSVFRDMNTNNLFDTGDVVLGEAQSSKGKFTFVTRDIKVASTIQAIDIDGNLAPEGKAFTLKESIKVTPTDVFPDQEITIELVDWAVGEVDQVRFGGTGATIENDRLVPARGSPDESGETFKVKVPVGSRLGSLKVEALVNGSSKASATITVKAQELSISPTSAVQGQEITITGTGFGGDKRIDSLTFGGGTNVYADTATSGRPVADSNGNVTITATVPNDVAAGDREVKVTAENNRSGTASLTVPKAVLTASPDTGLRGTMVMVTGTGFPANDLIQVQYDDFRTNDDGTPRTVTTANSDSTGNFSAEFEVPSYARIGQTQKITAAPQLTEDDIDPVKVDHSTPKPTMTLSPAKASPGQRITVSGASFAGYAPVAELMVSNRDIKPVPTPETDRDGSITMTGILVPQLDAGSYIVKIDIGGEKVTRFLEVTDEPVSTDPADVFEPIENVLTVVWRYDNAAASWASYSPTAPAALNDLAMVTTDTIVWIQVSAAVADFHGQPLVAGWNLITLR